MTEEIIKVLEDMKFDSKTQINGFTVINSRYEGIKVYAYGKYIDSFNRYSSVAYFLVTHNANESQEKSELQTKFFEENHARIQEGVIVHRVWHDRLGGDTIRDGIDGSYCTFEPMERKDVDAWCVQHGTTFEELFKK